MAAPVCFASGLPALPLDDRGHGMARSATFTNQAGMIGNLPPATDAEIERLLANPSEITRFLYGSDATRDGRERVDLGKTWHAIHFALTGARLGGDAPLNFLADEGTPG